MERARAVHSVQRQYSSEGIPLLNCDTHKSVVETSDERLWTISRARHVVFEQSRGFPHNTLDQVRPQIGRLCGNETEILFKKIKSEERESILSLGGRFRVVDIAARLGSGVGSFGVDRYYVLLSGVDDLLGEDPTGVILDVKYEPMPAVRAVLDAADAAWYDMLFSNDARRAITGPNPNPDTPTHQGQRRRVFQALTLAHE